jgi:glyoxylase-like metal-dependent hydrolase (beta-lactamase superfamily II)
VPLVRRVVAPNPGPYTGPGTNTWIVDAGPIVIVIDPGPDDDRHLAAIDRKLAGATVGVVLVTHSHPDHLPLADRLAAKHMVSVRRYPELGDGDIVRAGTLNLTALYTPGHSADHLCFWMAEDRAVFTGDLVLGKGSSMVTYPEGNVAAYLGSLERLIDLKPTILFPGHWDPVKDAVPKLDEYRNHRLQREAQVLSEVRRRKGSAQELTRRVYGPEVGEELILAAEMTMRAHLEKLVDDGKVRILDGEIFEANADPRKRFSKSPPRSRGGGVPFGVPALVVRGAPPEGA